MEDKEIAATGDFSDAASEKTLTTAQVNDIVKREKARAADRARQEMEALHQEELIKVKAESKGGTEGFDPEALSNQVYDRLLSEVQKHRDEQEKQAQERFYEDKANQYHLKMKAGSPNFEDYNEIMGDFKPAEFPNAVMLAAEMENTPEVMYELVKNPSKLLEIDALARTSPAMAKKQLDKLSKSIAENVQAKQSNVNAPAPLSRLKSSSVGADSGKMTIKDYKNQPWLRG